MNQATAYKNQDKTSMSPDSPENQGQQARPTTGNSAVEFKVLRRNGSVADFQPDKIKTAMMKAFLAVEGEGGTVSSKIKDQVSKLTERHFGHFGHFEHFGHF